MKLMNSNRCKAKYLTLFTNLYRIMFEIIMSDGIIFRMSFNLFQSNILMCIFSTNQNIRICTLQVYFYDGVFQFISHIILHTTYVFLSYYQMINSKLIFIDGFDIDEMRTVFFFYFNSILLLFCILTLFTAKKMQEF